jgi:low affinity Fe/Cu permease
MVFKFFEKLAVTTTQWTGSTKAFITALSVIFLWIICGPIFNYCDTWQLVINTSTTIVTFMMVFLLQRAHNKESLTIQIKLNELIASQKGASNKLINIEHLTEDEIKEIHSLFDNLARMAHEDSNPLKSQSVENIIKKK